MQNRLYAKTEAEGHGYSRNQSREELRNIGRMMRARGVIEWIGISTSLTELGEYQGNQKKRKKIEENEEQMHS